MSYLKLYLLTLLIVVGGVSVYSWNNVEPKSQPQNTSDKGITSQTVKPKPKQDKEILAQAKYLGLDVSDVALVKEEFEDPEQRAEYRMDKTIAMSAGADNVDLAHEYIHHYQSYKMSDQELKTLQKEAYRLYDNDAGMQYRMRWYDAKELSEYRYANELIAIYCTESSDNIITAYLVQACNNMIDRSKLVFIR